MKRGFIFWGFFVMVGLLGLEVVIGAWAVGGYYARISAMRTACEAIGAVFHSSWDNYYCFDPKSAAKLNP